MYTPEQLGRCLCVPGTIAALSRSQFYSPCKRFRIARHSIGRSYERLSIWFTSFDMSNQICLKWNSFLNNIATSFESLWEEEGLVDVTLASDGQCLTAHKVILSASSPFFKKVFQVRRSLLIFQDSNTSREQVPLSSSLLRPISFLIRSIRFTLFFPLSSETFFSLSL